MVEFHMGIQQASRSHKHQRLQPIFPSYVAQTQPRSWCAVPAHIQIIAVLHLQIARAQALAVQTHCLLKKKKKMV